jgi:hypothetical protein
MTHKETAWDMLKTELRTQGFNETEIMRIYILQSRTRATNATRQA